jgi:hypothetical protein
MVLIDRVGELCGEDTIVVVGYGEEVVSGASRRENK